MGSGSNSEAQASWNCDECHSSCVIRPRRSFRTGRDRIQRLAEQLAKVRDAIEQQDLAARIQREIQAAKNALQPPTD